MSAFNKAMEKLAETDLQLFLELAITQVSDIYPQLREYALISLKKDPQSAFHTRKENWCFKEIVDSILNLQKNDWFETFFGIKNDWFEGISKNPFFKEYVEQYPKVAFKLMLKLIDDEEVGCNDILHYIEFNRVLKQAEKSDFFIGLSELIINEPKRLKKQDAEFIFVYLYCSDTVGKVRGKVLRKIELESEADKELQVFNESLKRRIVIEMNKKYHYPLFEKN